jgi:sigma-B regulation protein RsbU (phosphoserine phosphatase)
MKPDGAAGGDFYDYFMIGEDTFCVLVAEVPGEGMPATLFKLSTRTMIRDHARMGLSPAEVFTKVNDLLREGNDAGMTVTAFMACLNVRTGRLTYVNAGHSVQYARRGSESYRPIICDTGMPLAASQGEQFIQGEMEFAPGDMLYLCTDGNLLGEGGMLSLEFICKPLP